MIIVFHKDFDKRYQKLHRNIQNKVDEKIRMFQKNPHDVILRNHPLKGKLFGKRAFSVSGDMRIVFQEYDSYMLVFILDIGTHNQVY